MGLIQKTTLKERNNTSNSIRGKEVDIIISGVLKELCGSLKPSLGPNGGTSVLEDRGQEHRYTKDGATIYKEISCYNTPWNLIHNQIRFSAMSNQDIKAGDGTTSVLMSIGNGYETIGTIRDKKKYKTISRKVFTDSLTYLRKYCSTIIKEDDGKYRLDLSDINDKEMHKYLTNVATIAMNNDTVRGKVVADMYMSMENRTFGFTNIEWDRGAEEDTFDKDRGFEYARGHVLAEMANMPDLSTCEYENVRYLMVDGQITDYDKDAIDYIIKEVCIKNEEPLCVISTGFTSIMQDHITNEMLAYKSKHRGRKQIPLVLITMGTNTHNEASRFQDLEALVGATSFRTNNGKNLTKDDILDYDTILGKSRKIITTPLNTRILGPVPDEKKVEQRLAIIDNEIDILPTIKGYDVSSEVYNMKVRKAMLSNDMVTLKVAGNTDQELTTLEDAYTDAVSACKNVFTTGVVLGGNLTITFVLEDLLNDNDAMEQIIQDLSVKCSIKVDKLFRSVIRDIVIAYQESFKQTYGQVLENKFPNNKRLINKIINKCVNGRCIYNITQDRYESLGDENCMVINSAESDLTIIDNTTSTLGTLLSINQLVMYPLVNDINNMTS